jgi:hypothetical protein
VSRRRTSSGTIFWGLTLVAVGGLLLARNFGFSIPIWGALARYWPLLIIGWGLLKLVDFYRTRNDPDRRPVFSGGEVVMLIFVIFAGSAITTAANINPDFGQFFDFNGNFDFWDITGNNYSYPEHHELDVEAASTIRIFNMYGSVDIKPSDGDRIILDVERVVRAENKADADRRAQEFTFSILKDGNRYGIASNRDESSVRSGISWDDIRNPADRTRYKSNLTIKVPRRALLDLYNKYGTVTVEGIDGNQTIRNKYGSTSVHDITGNLDITTGYGSVIVENISGDTKVVNSHASTTVRNIGGKVDIDNKYGSVDVQDIKNDATLVNQYSVVNVQRVTGKLGVSGRNNSVDIDDVVGAINIVTSYKNLNIRNVKGGIQVSNRHGNIDIELDQAPKDEIRVDGDYSDVSIELPAEAAFSFDGQTRNGDVDSEFDSISTDSSGRNRTLRGQRGSGGPRVVVETQHGDIRLQKRG